MVKKLIISIGMFLFCMGLLSSTEINLIPGEIIIHFHDNVRGDLFTDFIESYSEFDLTEIKKMYGRYTNGSLFSFNNERIDNYLFLEMIRTNNKVRIAQLNYYLKMDDFIPNDPFFENQWALNNTITEGADIDALRAWDILEQYQYHYVFFHVI